MEETLALALANAHRPCTKKIELYMKDVPCGTRRGDEWGKSNTGMNEAMITKSAFLDVFKAWGSLLPGCTKAPPLLSFVASCVEQGIDEFAGNMRPYRIVLKSMQKKKRIATATFGC